MPTLSVDQQNRSSVESAEAAAQNALPTTESCLIGRSSNEADLSQDQAYELGRDCEDNEALALTASCVSWLSILKGVLGLDTIRALYQSCSKVKVRKRLIDPVLLLCTMVMTRLEGGDKIYNNKRVQGILAFHQKNQGEYMIKPVNIFRSAIHKIFNSFALRQTATLLLERVVEVAHQSLKISPVYQDFAAMEAYLAEALGLNAIEIIIVDGTELAVMARSKHHFACKGKTKGKSNKNNKGEKIEPTALKLHVSMAGSGAIRQLHITPAASDERMFVRPWKYKTPKLFICDRGYYSYKLARSIIAHAHFFIFRLKGDFPGIIIEAVDESGNRIEALEGKKVCGKTTFDGMDKYQTIDMIVEVRNPKDKSETMRFRVVRALTDRGNRSGSTDGKGQFNLFATNLKREQVLATQIVLLYALRWSVEQAISMMKSTCGLETVDSGKKNVVWLWIITALIAYHVKLLLASKALTTVHEPADSSKSATEVPTTKAQQGSKANLSREKLFSTPTVTAAIISLYTAIVRQGKSSCYAKLQQLRTVLIRDAQREPYQKRKKVQIRSEHTFPEIVSKIMSIRRSPSYQPFIHKEEYSIVLPSC